MLPLIPIALLALAASQAPASLRPDAAAEAEIRTIVADQVVAWNAGDGKGYARRLAPEASFTNHCSMRIWLIGS